MKNFIGIENVKEIGWDKTNFKKDVGIKDENDYLNMKLKICLYLQGMVLQSLKKIRGGIKETYKQE